MKRSSFDFVSIRQAHGVIKYVGKALQYAAEIMTIAESVLQYILGKPQYILKGNSIILGWKKCNG